MGEIMLYIRGFRLFPGKSAACFRSCAVLPSLPLYIRKRHVLQKDSAL